MDKRDVISPGDCVKTPDGRIARVREVSAGRYIVRVRRMSGRTSQFLMFTRGELESVPCPKGWMSPDGYNRYLRATLEKMRQRLSLKGKNKKTSSGAKAKGNAKAKKTAAGKREGERT